MKKIVIYCHGYGSSSKSTKYLALKSAGFDAYCFDASVDPGQARRSLSTAIDSLLKGSVQQDENLVFVGTSLGGWTASCLAEIYSAEAIIINPAVDPASSLLKYGLPKEICEQYTPLVPNKRHQYYFAEVDEVIDNTLFAQQLVDTGFNVTVVPGADHRFDKHFGLVIDYLKGL